MPQITTLAVSAERALFEGRVPALVAACYVDERPLQGLAGILDWRFAGAISQCLCQGAVTGQPGECAYLPLVRGGRVCHLLLIGAGHLPTGRARGPLPPESVRALSANLVSLRLPQIGVSRQDLGDPAPEWFDRHLKGIPLCILN
jgi:hypothetical protein